MKKFSRCVLLGMIFNSVFIFSHFAFAKVAFMDLEELVAKSDTIAVIEITKSEEIGRRFDRKLPKKGDFSCSQKNNFIFIEFLKTPKEGLSDLKKNQTLWAGESFICASTNYTKGRYLVFLKNVGRNEWVTLNFELGGFSIDEKENVARFSFYKKDTNIPFEVVNINEAKEMILKALLGKNSELEITISTQGKYFYTINQDIRIEVKIKNIGRQGYYINKRDWGLGLRIEDKDGVELERLQNPTPPGPLLPARKDDYIFLEPGQEFTIEIARTIFVGEVETLGLSEEEPFVRKRGAFIEGDGFISASVLRGSGVYKLWIENSGKAAYASYYDGDITEGLRRGLKPEDYKKINTWQGTIKSNVVEIEIIGIDEAVNEKRY